MTFNFIFIYVLLFFFIIYQRLAPVGPDDVNRGNERKVKYIWMTLDLVCGVMERDEKIVESIRVEFSEAFPRFIESFDFSFFLSLLFLFHTHTQTHKHISKKHRLTRGNRVYSIPYVDDRFKSVECL